MEMKVRGYVQDHGEEPQAMSVIRTVSDGYKAFRVLQAGLRSGLFDWLAQNGPAERPAISAALNLRGAHLAGFLQALEDLGALARTENRYALADGMEQVLCQDSPWYQGATLDDMLAAPNGWSALDRFMSTDWSAPAQTSSGLTLQQHPYFCEAHRVAAFLAQRIGAPGGKQQVICFDGGEGQMAAALCQAFPDAQITAAVPENKLAATQATLAACGVETRCEVLAGSPLTPPEGEFDLAVLFHSLYALRSTTNDVLAAVAGRLAPGGELYCAHWFCLEACDTAPGGLRDLDKAVLTDSHPMCHVETFCDRFGKIGLADADRADLQGEYGTTKLHFARKLENAQE